MVGKSINDLDFKGSKLLFMGIQRKGKFLFNPLHSILIESGDILLVMGREISLDYFKSLYEEVC